MEHATGNRLTAAQLTESERRKIEHFASRLGSELGSDLRALWLYGSRARGTAHPESDVDLLVIADGGRDRYGRIAGDISEEAANRRRREPFNYSVHVHDPEWLQGRRARSSPSSSKRLIATRSSSLGAHWIEPPLRGRAGKPGGSS